METTKSKSFTQVVAKARHTERRFNINAPLDQIIRVLRNAFGNRIKVVEDEDQFVNAADAEWYKATKRKMTPGKILRIYRENKGWSQAELGHQLGGLTRQYVSGMERGDRGISKTMAKRLASLFKTTVERFI